MPSSHAESKKFPSEHLKSASSGNWSLIYLPDIFVVKKKVSAHSSFSNFFLNLMIIHSKIDGNNLKLHLNLEVWYMKVF